MRPIQFAYARERIANEPRFCRELVLGPDVLKLTAAALSEVSASGLTSRGRWNKYLFDGSSGEVLLDLGYANAKLLSGGCERHKDGETLVSSDGLSTVGEALGGYFDQVAGFRKSRFGHPFTITVSQQDWKQNTNYTNHTNDHE
jgi:hypothetical protein